MKFKKLILVFIIVISSISINNISYATTFNAESDAAILVNTNTGKILYEKNAYKTMYPASTTKIMTAILAIENCNLEDSTTVSDNAEILPVGYPGNLKAGEEFTIRDLLYYLLLDSSNDGAIVLAEYVAGNVDNFADMMNKKALELGCKNTHFVNPNGVHDDNHYSTAYDLFLIAQYAMKNDTFRSIVSTASYTVNATNLSEEKELLNTNMLLHTNLKATGEENIFYYKYAIGVKTGYTPYAKNCLVSAAKKDGVEYIAVVLGSATNETTYVRQRFSDSKNLLSTAIDNYSLKTYKHTNDIITNISIPNGNYFKKNLNLVLDNDINILMNNSDLNLEIEPKITLYEDKLQAPIKEGAILGSVNFIYDGVSYTGNLLAANDVSTNNQLYLCIVLILVILLAVKILNNNKKKKLKRRIAKKLR